MLSDTQPSRIPIGLGMNENPRSRLSFWPKGPSICLAQVVGLGTTPTKEVRRANGPAVCIHQSAPSSVGTEQMAGPLALQIASLCAPRPMAWARQNAGPLARSQLALTGREDVNRIKSCEPPNTPL